MTFLTERILQFISSTRRCLGKGEFVWVYVRTTVLSLKLILRDYLKFPSEVPLLNSVVSVVSVTNSCVSNEVLAVYLIFTCVRTCEFIFRKEVVVKVSSLSVDMRVRKNFLFCAVF